VELRVSRRQRDSGQSHQERIQHCGCGARTRLVSRHEHVVDRQPKHEGVVSLVEADMDDALERIAVAGPREGLFGRFVARPLQPQVGLMLDGELGAVNEQSRARIARCLTCYAGVRPLGCFVRLVMK
jgi:hypothetical protein